MPKTTTPTSIRLDTNDSQLFQRLYPYCLSRFVKNCVKMALNDRHFFDKIYFMISEEK